MSNKTTARRWQPPEAPPAPPPSPAAQVAISLYRVRGRIERRLGFMSLARLSELADALDGATDAEILAGLENVRARQR